MEAAVKLVSKFSESDVETFLISFEKVAELNNYMYPPDKYAAILQAHLTGKALKVFTELSVEECRKYPTLKAALLQAYSVVLEEPVPRVDVPGGTTLTLWLPPDPDVTNDTPLTACWQAPVCVVEIREPLICPSKSTTSAPCGNRRLAKRDIKH